MRAARRALVALGLLFIGARQGHAQSMTAGVAALLDSETASQLALGYQVPRLGPVLFSLGAVRLGASSGDRWGAGFDLALRLGHNLRLYPVAGLSAGWGTGNVEGTWGSWSAGLGYELLRSRGVGLSLEGRYLQLSSPEGAVTIGLRMGVRFRGAREPASGPTLSTALPTVRSPAADAVIRTALDAMGTPYVWGGTDANGFDCSGLILFAYRAQGIALPRTSRDQAREGVAVPRDTLALVAGDILAFAASGQAVSHVGLYLGSGEFIHSGRTGVQIGRLRPDDPDGGYWWRRWVGARRVLPDPAVPQDQASLPPTHFLPD